MIHVILGAPCSGKSTYVREHAQKGDVIDDFDEIARALGADGHLPDGDIKQAAFRARKAVIDYCVETKCESWIIHSMPTDEQREAYEKAGAEQIVMETDMETCLQRAADDGRPPGTEQIIRDYFENSACKGAFLMPEKRLTMHQFKACVKSELKEDGGTVKGYASTFDRDPDAYGDVVAKGAFAKSLERWEALNAEGKYIPLLWGHDTEDPKSNIGRVIEAEEDERGLLITAEFDADNEKAQYVRKLVQEGRVYQFSFAFEIRDQAPVELENGMKANELRDLELFEVSLVQIPANQHATVEEVKSDVIEVELKPRISGLTDEQRKEFTKAITEATHNGLEIGLKAGRRNSAKDADELRKIASAAAEIQEVVNGLLADDETPAEDGEEESEAAKAAEGETSQAEFVDAYKQAVKEWLGEPND